jgi:predicted kinase
MLVIFSGLPCVGKTSLARELARQLGAVHLRIDSIELAMWAAGVDNPPLDEAGYRVAYAVAADNLRIGNMVIADSVNPRSETRAAWVAVADGVAVKAFEIEVICSDPDIHRRRVEARVTDIPGFTPPTWEEVCCREYEAWDRDHLVIDTSARSVEQNVSTIRELILAR